jgi:hypothetical protein
MCVCVSAFARACVCVRACVRMCVRAHVRACARECLLAHPELAGLRPGPGCYSSY